MTLETLVTLKLGKNEYAITDQDKLGVPIL